MSKMEQPLVSVLMTAFNREQYIEEAIQSVLSSNYPHFELIIVDDVSSDRTVELAKKYKQSDTRVKLYVNEQNLGDYANRNKAVSYASGEFIMFVDSDDRILADGLDRCVRGMQLFPDASFGMYYGAEPDNPFVIPVADTIRNHFFKKAFLFIGPGGTIMRRSFFKDLNGYPEKYGPANDMYFNLKAACYTPMLLLPFEFIFYRRHEGQEINNRYSYLSNNYRYLRDALKELPLPLEEDQKRWIDKKNKRRFTVNIIKYFLSTFHWPKTAQAIRAAEFSLKDALTGIFQRK